MVLKPWEISWWSVALLSSSSNQLHHPQCTHQPLHTSISPTLNKKALNTADWRGQGTAEMWGIRNTKIIKNYYVIAACMEINIIIYSKQWANEPPAKWSILLLGSSLAVLVDGAGLLVTVCAVKRRGITSTDVVCNAFCVEDDRHFVLSTHSYNVTVTAVYATVSVVNIELKRIHNKASLWLSQNVRSTMLARVYWQKEEHPISVKKSTIIRMTTTAIITTAIFSFFL